MSFRLLRSPARTALASTSTSTSGFAFSFSSRGMAGTARLQDRAERGGRSAHSDAMDNLADTIADEVAPDDAGPGIEGEPSGQSSSKGVAGAGGTGPLASLLSALGGRSGQQPARRREASPATQELYTRAFKHGQYYDPSSLAYESMNPARVRVRRPELGPPARVARRQDPFHKLSLSFSPSQSTTSSHSPSSPSRMPSDVYKNPVVLSHYVSDMGKIQSRAKTGLGWKSQRGLGKAIRRARSMGILPVLSKGIWGSRKMF